MVLASTHLYKHTHVDVLILCYSNQGENHPTVMSYTSSHKCIPRVVMSTMVSSKGYCGTVGLSIIQVWYEECMGNRFCSTVSSLHYCHVVITAPRSYIVMVGGRGRGGQG